MNPLDRICSIYKSPKKDEMYIYVSKQDGLKRVPEALLDMFGAPVHVMDMMIKPGRQMARADGEKIVSEIISKGFYLQMPPPKEDYLLDLLPKDK